MLKPVKNYRERKPRPSCATCAHFLRMETAEGELHLCRREFGPSGSWDELRPYWHRCDRYVERPSVDIEIWRAPDDSDVAADAVADAPDATVQAIAKEPA